MAKTADELAALLKRAITSGALKVGDKLPSLTDLMNTHGVGKGVAQPAMNRLRAEGLVEARHGAGYFVKANVPTRAVDESQRLVLRQNWADSLPQGDGPGKRAAILRIDEVPAPDFVAMLLRIEEGDPVLLRRARVDFEGRPAHIEDAYYPVDLARGTAIVYHDTGAGGIHARLAEQGEAPVGGEVRLIGRPATAEEASELKLKPPSSMVLDVIQHVWSKSKRPVEVCRAVMVAELYQVAYDIG